MDGWWWIPIGLVTWFAVAMAVALWLGAVLRNCSQAREAFRPGHGQDASPAQTAAPALAVGWRIWGQGNGS